MFLQRPSYEMIMLWICCEKKSYYNKNTQRLLWGLKLLVYLITAGLSGAGVNKISLLESGYSALINRLLQRNLKNSWMKNMQTCWGPITHALRTNTVCVMTAGGIYCWLLLLCIVRRFLLMKNPWLQWFHSKLVETHWWCPGSNNPEQKRR